MITNRVRGSLQEYEWYNTQSVWRWPNSYPEYHDWGMRQTKDVYAPYGVGVWPYKPFESIKLEHRGGISNHGPFINLGCCDPGYTNSADGQDCWDHPNQGIQQVSVPDVMKGRLSGKVEARLPSLRPTTDAFVFFAEIKDIAEIASLIKTRAGGLLDNLAEKDLTYHFSFAPLAGELTGLIRQIQSWRQRVAALKGGVGRVHDFKASVMKPGSGEWVKTGESAYPWYPPGCTQTCPNGLLGGFHTWKREQINISAVVKYRYEWPKELNKLEGRIATFLTSVGLMPNAASLWELVPFSFVVDWVFNTSRAISALGLDFSATDVQTEIIDVCYTEYQATSESHMWNFNCYGAYASPGSGSRLETTIIRRYAGNEAMNELQSPYWHVPGFMQIHLGASLLRVLGRR